MHLDRERRPKQTFLMSGSTVSTDRTNPSKHLIKFCYHGASE